MTVATFQSILERDFGAGDAISCMVGNPLTARIHRLILPLLVIWSLFLLPVSPTARAQEEEPTPLDPAIEQLLAQMTPEEKVGQLFLVTKMDQ